MPANVSITRKRPNVKRNPSNAPEQPGGWIWVCILGTFIFAVYAVRLMGLP